METFLEEIRSVGIFIICARAVIHFRPKASYEKYLKVLTAIIVLVMLITPCFEMLGNMENFLCSMEQYESFFHGREAGVWKSYEEGGEEAGDNFLKDEADERETEEKNQGIVPVIIEKVVVTE